MDGAAGKGSNVTTRSFATRTQKKQHTLFTRTLTLTEGALQVRNEVLLLCIHCVIMLIHFSFWFSSFFFFPFFFFFFF